MNVIEPLLELRDVSKTYGEGDSATHALRDVCLTIHQGEFVAIVGPSGSGKSTLMHILGFLDSPTRGTYLLRGKSVTMLDEDDLARIRSEEVSFVFQAFNLLPRATVLTNVLLPLLYHPSITSNEREERARKAIDRVGLTQHIGHLSNQLSGGQQQRVAIARALVTDAKVLFADEPTGNLDSAAGMQIMDALHTLHDDGHTIILVTHDPNIARHARRIITMRDGNIVSDQTSGIKNQEFPYPDPRSPIPDHPYAAP